jgi:hypothetical protein
MLPFVDAAGGENLGEVHADVLLHGLNLVGHAPGIVDDDDDVDWFANEGCHRIGGGTTGVGASVVNLGRARVEENEGR